MAVKSLEGGRSRSRAGAEAEAEAGTRVSLKNGLVQWKRQDPWFVYTGNEGTLLQVERCTTTGHIWNTWNS